MYYVSAQGVDERMINVHYLYYYVYYGLCWDKAVVKRYSEFAF